jgi:hypothetical protein
MQTVARFETVLRHKMQTVASLSESVRSFTARPRSRPHQKEGDPAVPRTVLHWFNQEKHSTQPDKALEVLYSVTLSGSYRLNDHANVSDKFVRSNNSSKCQSVLVSKDHDLVRIKEGDPVVLVL